MVNSLLLIKSLILSDPTLAVRTLLNTTYVTASSGNTFVEVWPCQPLRAKLPIEFLPQNHSCTYEIPINFQLQGQTNHGYLNPSALIVSHVGAKADCDTVSTTTIQLHKELLKYNRSTGQITKVKNTETFARFYTSTFHPLSEHWVRDFTFRPVVIYTWQELEPQNNLNKLWHSLAMQSDALNQLGLSFSSTSTYNNSTQPAINDFLVNSINQSMFHLSTWFSLYFHIWVTIVCSCICISQLVCIWKKLKTCKSNEQISIRNVINRAPKLKRRNKGEARPTQDNISGSDPQISLTSFPDVDDVCGFTSSKTLVPVRCNKTLVTALIDTGATCSLISHTYATQLKLSFLPCSRPAVAITGDRLDIVGEAYVSLELGQHCHLQKVKIFVDCKYDLVLGTDLEKLGQFNLILKIEIFMLVLNLSHFKLLTAHKPLFMPTKPELSHLGQWF